MTRPINGLPAGILRSASSKPAHAPIDFVGMQRALADAEVAQPVLVIDRERLDANLDHLEATVGDALDLRIVAKSLPSPELLRRTLERLRTNRLMTFNLPMLIDISERFPTADQLCGKPFPVTAAAQFHRAVGRDQADRVQWLIDTTDRLTQYDDLATGLGTRLRVSLELDVGLHRGGFESDRDLRLALDQISRSDHLTFAGYMGYEPHVAKYPAGPVRRRMFANSIARYRAAVDLAVDVLGADRCGDAVFNGAGSPTYRLHDAGTPVTELSVGSALLKGTDFDTDLLAGFQPVMFIAAPVLKVLPTAKVPGFELIDRALSRLNRSRDRAVFIHGGHWLAEGVHPEGLSNDAVFGRSSNQEMFRVPNEAAVAPDDFVFLRPTQSEAVLLQFGALAIYDRGRIVENWTVFPPSP